MKDYIKSFLELIYPLGVLILMLSLLFIAINITNEPINNIEQECLKLCHSKGWGYIDFKVKNQDEWFWDYKPSIKDVTCECSNGYIDVGD